MVVFCIDCPLVPDTTTHCHSTLQIVCCLKLLVQRGAQTKSPARHMLDMIKAKNKRKIFIHIFICIRVFFQNHLSIDIEVYFYFQLDFFPLLHSFQRFNVIYSICIKKIKSPYLCFLCRCPET